MVDPRSVGRGSEGRGSEGRAPGDPGARGSDDDAPAPAPDRRAGATGRVLLVVDDDADVLETVAETLRAAGHQVRTATDGLEALQRAEELGADLGLLLTDVDMPGMDGPTLAARLRARDGDVPVLLMSGAPPAQPVPETAFLAKPFRGSTLTRAVAALLRAPEPRP